MKKLIMLLIFTVSLSGCFVGMGTKKDFYILGWPPTVKELAERCDGTYYSPFYFLEKKKK